MVQQYTGSRHRGLTVSALLCALMVIALPAVAARQGNNKSGGGSTSTSCTPNAPDASVDNTWAWASPGSWGMPGQKLEYAVDVFNNDVGCGSSSFTVTASAPDGFSLSIPSATVTLSSGSNAYVWAYVTSPSSVSNGDYAVTVSVARAGSASAPVPSATTSYKVYSSDTVAPKLYWENPSNGDTLSGRTAYVGFASSDDHAVKKLSLSIDGVSVSSTLCDDISYDCQLSYKWSLRRAKGAHTVTFESTDWMANVARDAVTFTVG